MYSMVEYICQYRIHFFFILKIRHEIIAADLYTVVKLTPNHTFHFSTDADPTSVNRNLNTRAKKKRGGGDLSGKLIEITVHCVFLD